MTAHMSLIHLPWSVKILYGLISDNVPIFGTRRKSYLVIMGLVQFFSLSLIFLIHDWSVWAVTICLTMASMSEAFVMVVADAILCI
jgi:MFS family permease